MMLSKFRQKDLRQHDSIYVQVQKIKLTCSDRKWTHQGVLEDGERGKKGRVAKGQEEILGMKDSVTTGLRGTVSHGYRHVKTYHFVYSNCEPFMILP